MDHETPKTNISLTQKKCTRPKLRDIKIGTRYTKRSDGSIWVFRGYRITDYRSKLKNEATGVIKWIPKSGLFSKFVTRDIHDNPELLKG